MLWPSSADVPLSWMPKVAPSAEPVRMYPKPLQEPWPSPPATNAYARLLNLDLVMALQAGFAPSDFGARFLSGWASAVDKACARPYEERKKRVVAKAG